MSKYFEDEQVIAATHKSWDLLISLGRMVAELPLESWLEAFSRAETVAPLLDPTLYRDYIHDPERKGDHIQALIQAALPLKREILRLQDFYQPQRPGTPGQGETDVPSGESK